MPQPSDLPIGGRRFHHNPTHILPLFKIPFPDDIASYPYEFLDQMTLPSWYFESESVYFDVFCDRDFKLQRFKIVIEPDLTVASLDIINMSETISNDVIKFLIPHYSTYKACDGYRVCEDALVYFWNTPSPTRIMMPSAGPANTGLILTSTPFTNVVTGTDTRWTGRIDSLCPASGRLVYHDCTDGRTGDEGNSFSMIRIVVVDLF